MAEGGQQNGGGDRKPKRKVWISLSRKEIEEDVYTLTGGKLSRRPRKWPKNVQKQLDNGFPGLYMVGVVADSYQVMMLCLGIQNTKDCSCSTNETITGNNSNSGYDFLGIKNGVLDYRNLEMI